MLLLWCSFAYGQRSFPIADGWARTKVNAVIVRRNALCTFGDQQVAAFYDGDSKVVLAKRTLNSGKWQLAEMWAFTDPTPTSVGQADPMIDPMVWEQHKAIHLRTQFVGQGDGEREER